MCRDAAMATKKRKPRTRRSKPCSICRRWFTPDPRLGLERQRTCGRPECMAKQKQKTQAQWSRRQPSYWTEQRLAKQIERAKQGEFAGVLRGPPAEMARTPANLAQEAIGIECLVIMAFIARIIHRGAQEVIRKQVSEIHREIRAINPVVAQDATAPGGPDP